LVSHLSEERLHGPASDFDKCVGRVCMVPGSVGGRVLCTRWRLSVQRSENDLSQKDNAISFLLLCKQKTILFLDKINKFI
jgi:hypothetical protein